MGARGQAGKWLVRLVLGRENGIRSGARRWLRRGWDSVRGRGAPGAPFGTGDPAGSSNPGSEDDGPEGFQLAARSDEVVGGELLEVTVGGEALLLVRGETSVHCVSAVCPHAGGALGDGFVESGQLVCPLHGWGFALDDGACSVNPAARLPCYEVQEEGGRIWIGQRRSNDAVDTGEGDA